MKVQEAFKNAFAAKITDDFKTSNLYFAYLLNMHRKGNDSLKIGYLFHECDGSPKEFFPELSGEAPPDEDGELNTFNVWDKQYHGLFYFQHAGLQLCIPACILSTENIKYCFNAALNELGIEKRIEEDDDDDDDDDDEFDEELYTSFSEEYLRSIQYTTRQGRNR